MNEKLLNGFRKCLILLFFAGCISMETGMSYQTEVSFSPVEFEKVWSACIAEILDSGLKITLSDRDAGLLVAGKVTNIWTANEIWTYTITVTQGEDGIFLKVYVDAPALYSASTYVNKFIEEVEARLNEDL